jgi:hypothetical protein
MSRSTSRLALLGLMLIAGTAAAQGQPATGSGRGLPFWTALAKDCAVPAGETAAGLVREAVAFLGSPDTAWRDDVGYGVVVTCVYEKRALEPDDRRALVATLVANLRRGIGESGTDSVLLRSFSALDLSVLAALEDDSPALDAGAYRALLDAAFAYLWDERDLRGLEPRVGWIHATAHTSDLLKYLARDPRFTPADQARLLDAAWAKMTTAGTPVFTHAEDERLAAAIASVVRRADFDAGRLGPWLERFPALEKRVWAKAPPEPRLVDATQNARNLLRSLFVVLSLPAPVPSGSQPPPAAPSVVAARERVLATLAAIRR